MTTVREALEPCPFCGGKAIWQEQVGGQAVEFAPVHRLNCSKCFRIDMPWWTDKLDCIKQWNTRAAAPGEPCAWGRVIDGKAVTVSIETAFEEWRRTLKITDNPSNQCIFGQGYVAGWNAKEAARPDTAESRLREALNEVVTNGEWTEGEQRGEWKISKDVYDLAIEARDKALSPPSGGDDDEIERLRDALSLALQYIPAQPTDSDAAKDIERIHNLTAGRAKAWDERPSGGDEAKESEGGVESGVAPLETRAALVGETEIGRTTTEQPEKMLRSKSRLVPPSRIAGVAPGPSEPSPPADRREIVARAMCCPDGCKYPDRCCAQSVQRMAHNGKQIDAILAALDGGRDA